MSEEKWVLMSTEHIPEVSNGMDLIFLSEESGDMKRIRKLGLYPFFYTYMTEEEMLNDPYVQEIFLKKKNDDEYTWKKNILSVERVEMKHPITLKITEVSKVTANTVWDLYNTRDGTGLANIIPDQFIFNHNHRYADYFLDHFGLVMGMPYSIAKSGEVTMLKEKHSKGIQEVIDKIKVPKYLEYALNEKLMDLFFTGFPDMSDHIMAIDIEVDNDYKRAINPFAARYPISSIGIYAKKFSKVVALSDSVRAKSYQYDMPEDINLQIVESEKVLLDICLSIIIKRPENFIITFNGDKFDIPYMCTRANLLSLHKWNREIWGRWDHRKNTVIKGIKNKFLVDLYPFFSNPSIKNYTFKSKYVRNSLDNITEALLGVSKYKFEGRINQLNANELAYYNYIDAKRTYELCTFNNGIVFDLIFMFMRISGKTFENIHRRKISAVLHGVMNTIMYNAGIMQPNRSLLAKLGQVASKSIIAGKSYKGAYVFDPYKLKSIGWWNKVVCIDFASLYPSEIKQRNLCFSTVNCEHETCKKNKMPGLPHHVCVEREGFISSLIGFIRDIRVMYFKEKADENPIYSIVEQTLKVLINAGYGVLGNEAFPYYASPIAEGTTAYGRRDIKIVEKYCNDHGVRVIYGDTDSIFLVNASDEFLETLFKWVKEELSLEMGIDYKGEWMLIHAKKNYLIDNEGTVVVRGMTGKKSNTPMFVRNCFSDVISIMKEGYTDTDKMKDSISKKVDEYVIKLYDKEFNPLDLKKTVKLGDDLFRYKVKGQHVRAAESLAQYLRSKIKDKANRVPDHLIVPKDTYIDFVLHTGNNPVPLEMMSNVDGVDIKYYQKALISSMSQILIPLKIKLDQFLTDKRMQSLDDWF